MQEVPILQMIYRILFVVCQVERAGYIVEVCFIIVDLVVVIYTYFPPDKYPVVSIALSPFPRTATTVQFILFAYSPRVCIKLLS